MYAKIGVSIFSASEVCSDEILNYLKDKLRQPTIVSRWIIENTLNFFYANFSAWM